MKVIVATEGSDVSIEAARKCLPLLREGAAIVLVTVVPDYDDPMQMSGGFEGPLETPEEAEAAFEKSLADGWSILNQTAADLGYSVETKVLAADTEPGLAIAKLANEIRADLIIVGARDQGLFHRVFGGSVSDYVVHHAPCPVMVARHPSA